MNVNPFAVAWICIFVLKVFGLINLTWWIVLPFGLMSAFELATYRK